MSTWIQWSEAEDDVIYEHYSKATREELLELLPIRTWRAIGSRARKLEVRRKQGRPRIDKKLKAEGKSKRPKVSKGNVKSIATFEAYVNEELEIVGDKKAIEEYFGIDSKTFKKWSERTSGRVIIYGAGLGVE